MKFAFFVLFFGVSLGALADLTLKDEAAQMGGFAGLAVNCHEDKKTLDNYELIASRIMANKALSEAEETEVKKEYVWQKLKKMKNNEKLSQAECRDFLRLFRQMPVFKSVVYANGGIKMPDGTYLPPKRPFHPKKNS